MVRPNFDSLYLLPALEQTRPDLVIYEALDAGAGNAASVLGVPRWHSPSSWPTRVSR